MYSKAVGIMGCHQQFALQAGNKAALAGLWLWFGKQQWCLICGPA